MLRADSARDPHDDVDGGTSDIAKGGGDDDDDDDDDDDVTFESGPVMMMSHRNVERGVSGE